MIVFASMLQNGVMIFIVKISINLPIPVVIKIVKIVTVAVIRVRQITTLLVDVLIQELLVIILSLGARIHLCIASLLMEISIQLPIIVVKKIVCAQLQLVR